MNYSGSASRRYLAVDRAKCWSCGFLAKYRDGLLCEVSVEDRLNGTLFECTEHHTINARPRCLIWAADLEREWDGWHKSGVARETAAIHVLNLDRQCEEWFPYQPGFSPKEHYEELRILQIEQQREAHEHELAVSTGEAQKSSEQIQRDSLEIATALRDATQRTASFTTRWTYVAAVIAFAALLAILMQYLFPDFGPAVGRWLGDVIRAP